MTGRRSQAAPHARWQSKPDPHKAQRLIHKNWTWKYDIAVAVRLIRGAGVSALPGPEFTSSTNRLAVTAQCSETSTIQSLQVL